MIAEFAPPLYLTALRIKTYQFAFSGSVKQDAYSCFLFVCVTRTVIAGTNLILNLAKI